MKQKLLSALVVMTILAPAAAFARAREPIVVTGPKCAEGSPRAAAWMLFEDMDGDGSYDHFTSGRCDGTTVSGKWDGSVEPDPWSPTVTVIGSLPVGSMNLVPTLTYNEQPSGVYTWNIVEHATATSPEVCHVQRDEAMTLSMSCPPQGDEDLH